VTRLRKRIVAVCAAVFLVATGATAASAAIVASGPPITSPTPTVGPFFSGPVHECVLASNEGVAYFELHSNTLGNCAKGWIQLTVNELTPTFTLKLGTGTGAVDYTCSAVTAAAETAVSCATPPPGG
jgi:hypothetical protein